ncbi:MAG: hypothetical protein H8E57_00595 [Candidatus Cloacimonetes bacterium]|nr:hypothetical protein [Candidatus Cloacimonadota bacterium]
MTIEKKFYEIQNISKKIFDADVELLPSVTELVELELSYLEFSSLETKKLLDRTAFIKSFENE